MALSMLLLIMVTAFMVGPAMAGYNYQPSYDRQYDTYHSQHEEGRCKEGVTVTPYFSPDHSIDTYVSLINSANESIDIFTPGFSSWSRCTSFSGCQGCTIEKQKKEKFPVFPALLNAKHLRNVKVRILTNNYNKENCEGKISPLDYLILNGIEVRGYTSTTFMHSKFMIIDKGKKTSISSVNFSYMSFLLNREAGIILDEGCKEAAEFHERVFETDWEKGIPFQVNSSYSDDEIKTITDPSPYPIVMPDPKVIPEAYITELTTIEAVKVHEVYTAPDYARDKLLDTMATTEKSLYLAIYEVTDRHFCDELEKMYKRGIDVKMVVSPTITGSDEQKEAEACYQQLYNAGMAGDIRYAPDYYRYSHEKFWIVDNTTVHLSTGNWATTDYQPGITFPPYGDNNWKKTNRNMLIKMESPAIVDIFYTVFREDGARGKEWRPPESTCDANLNNCSEEIDTTRHKEWSPSEEVCDPNLENCGEEH